MRMRLRQNLRRNVKLHYSKLREKYTSILKNAGINNILKIEIAFYGKEFEVKFVREI